MKKPIFCLALFIIGLVVVISFVERSTKEAVIEKKQSSKTTNPKVVYKSIDDSTSNTQSISFEFTQHKDNLVNDPAEWSALAEKLAEPNLPEAEYIETVDSLLFSYLTLVKTGVPTGLNVEITNALLGKNNKKFAFIEQNHPRINKHGQIVDKWGTPYFFHNESLRKIEVRSAGPDLILHTDDDIVSADN